MLKTQCKIRVNLGFTEPYKGELTVLHNDKKIKKLKNLDAGKINLKKIDFFENANFTFYLPNSYFLFEKKGLHFLVVLIAFFIL